MPSYKVLDKGFYGGVFRVPGGPHDPVITPAPIPKGEVPSWLELIKEETKTAKSRKAAAEKVTVPNASPSDFTEDDDGVETL